MKKFVLLFQLLIIIFSTTMAFMLFNIDFFFLSVIVMFLVFSVYFIYLLLRFDTQITYEEASCDPLLSAKEVDVCVVVVVKNEGEQIINTAKHYLSFPENVRMLVYDDDSTDDSILNLSELSEEYNNRLEIKKLVKRDL